MGRTLKPGTRTAPHRNEQDTTTRVLAIGNQFEAGISGGTGLLADHRFTTFTAFERTDYETYDPHIVIGPLIGEGFDAFEIAQFLQSRDFTGTLMIFAPRLPKPELVRSELSKAFPDLDIDVVSLNANPVD